MLWNPLLMRVSQLFILREIILPATGRARWLTTSASG
jgi:hypothetical protein